MRVSDLIEYLSRFKPDDRIDFVVHESEDCWTDHPDDPELGYGNTPTIKLEI